MTLPGAATPGKSRGRNSRHGPERLKAAKRPFFLSWSWWGENSLDVVDVHLLAAGAALIAAVRVAVLVELEAAVAVLAAAEVVRLVDLGGLGELAVGLERAGLVGCVLEAA